MHGLMVGVTMMVMSRDERRPDRRSVGKCEDDKRDGYLLHRYGQRTDINTPILRLYASWGK